MTIDITTSGTTIIFEMITWFCCSSWNIYDIVFRFTFNVFGVNVRINLFVVTFGADAVFINSGVTAINWGFNLMIELIIVSIAFTFVRP